MPSTQLVSHNPSNSLPLCQLSLQHTTYQPKHKFHVQHQNKQISYKQTIYNNKIFLFFLTCYLLNMHIIFHYTITSKLSPSVTYHHISINRISLSHDNLRFLVVYYTYFLTHITRFTYTRHKTLYLLYITQSVLQDLQTAFHIFHHISSLSLHIFVSSITLTNQPTLHLTHSHSLFYQLTTSSNYLIPSVTHTNS